VPVKCVPPTWQSVTFYSNQSGDAFMFSIADGAGCGETSPLGLSPHKYCPGGYAAISNPVEGASQCWPIGCHFSVPSIYPYRDCYTVGIAGEISAVEQIICRAPICPTGYTYDPTSGVCCETGSGPCPPGHCWCGSVRACIDCSFGKTCEGSAVNTWDSVTCKWIATLPICPAGQEYSWFYCACVPCAPNKCPCDPLADCVSCKNGLTPPCSSERGCRWNRGTCRWDCVTPPCDPGNHFDLKVCRCIPDCPTGNCWCDLASPPQCISCTPPLCAKYLNCEWNVATCTWECDSPPCDIALFDYAKCKCKPLHLLWLIRDEKNRLIRWSADTGGHLVQEIFEPGDVAPVATVIDPDHECDSACFHAINGWLVGTYLADGVLTLGKSRDHGKTWTMKPIPGDYTFARSVWHRKRLVVVGYRAGNLYMRVGKLLPDNDFDWSDPEVAVTPTLPHTSNGDLSLWVDGTTIVMTWGDTASRLHLSKCGFLKLDGTNLWRHEA
jgi:hypothetical protein